LQESAPLLAKEVRGGQLDVVGAFYDLGLGQS